MARYTRKQMAQRVGVSEGTIYRWERNKKIKRPKDSSNSHEDSLG